MIETIAREILHLNLTFCKVESCLLEMDCEGALMSYIACFFQYECVPLR